MTQRIPGTDSVIDETRIRTCLADAADRGHDAATVRAVLAKARELFFESGFRRITTDEIAHELGMSKKTLYQYFDSKRDLLRLCLEQRLDEMKEQIEGIIADRNRDFIKKIGGIFQAAFDLAIRISKNFIEDLRRYEPGLWQQIHVFRERVIFRHISGLLLDGRKKGMVRIKYCSPRK